MRQDEQTRLLSRSFGSVADDYDRLRPEPPAEALDWALPLDARQVAEIGAGTGKLTRLLVARVATVYAVEPDPRMREVMAARTPGATIIAGYAEQLPVPDCSVDAVIASSAWHWVDEARAVPEVARVLRPGGNFSLLWCGPDRTVAWMRSLWAGGRPLSDEGAAAVDLRRRERHTVDLGGHGWFSEPETRLLTWTAPMTKEDLVALAGTYSAVITMPDDERRAHLASMAAFLGAQEELAGSNLVDVPMRCLCWRVRRL